MPHRIKMIWTIKQGASQNHGPLNSSPICSSAVFRRNNLSPSARERTNCGTPVNPVRHVQTFAMLKTEGQNLESMDCCSECQAKLTPFHSPELRITPRQRNDWIRGYLMPFHKTTSNKKARAIGPGFFYASNSISLGTLHRGKLQLDQAPAQYAKAGCTWQHDLNDWPNPF